MPDPPAADLPPGFTVEPATAVHDAEVFDVYAAERVAAFGFCPDTIDESRAWLAPEVLDRGSAHLVRDADGAAVQFWQVLREPGDPVVHAWVRTHPRLEDPVADELAGAAWTQLFGWVRQHPPEGEGEIEVRSGCPAGGVAAHRHLATAGFRHERTFWEMIGPVTGPGATPPDLPGLTVHVADDHRVLHRVLDDGFAGHYGHVSQSFEDWYARERTEAGFDPDLWFLAALDGSVAAGMVLSRRNESAGALYVQELATLPAYRRRGIASALLARAFGVAAERGLHQVSLHVDSANDHDAPAVYRRAGLEVRCAFHAHGRSLPRQGAAGATP